MADGTRTRDFPDSQTGALPLSYSHRPTPGNRTLNLRFRKPVLCPVELKRVNVPLRGVEPRPYRLGNGRSSVALEGVKAEGRRFELLGPKPTSLAVTPNKPDSGNPLFYMLPYGNLISRVVCGLRATGYFPAQTSPWPRGHAVLLAGIASQVAQLRASGTRSHIHTKCCRGGPVHNPFQLPHCRVRRTRDHSLSVLTVAATSKPAPWVSRDTEP